MGTERGTRGRGRDTRLQVYAQIGREGTPAPMEVWGSIALSAESIGMAADLRSSPSDPELVIVMGVAPAGKAIAAALVPGALAGKARRNGEGAPEGLLLLKHGDLLELGDNQLWISGERAASETTYDPEKHGESARCARTKAVLKLGEAIVRCPGTPRRPDCGLLFRALAWPIARCHGCGHDPKQPSWTPPVPHARRSLDEYLERYLDA